MYNINYKVYYKIYRTFFKYKIRDYITSKIKILCHSIKSTKKRISI